MAVVLTIGGINRTSYVLKDSLRIDNIITKQVDRCTFVIRNSVGYIPAVGREVIITDNGTRVFGGVIVRRTDQSPVTGTTQYQVECSDYTRILDQHLVAQTYTDTTVEAIVQDLIDTWAPAGFTYTQVDCPVPITSIQFKYEPVSACMEQLANIAQADWYVDYNKDVFFKDPSANSAPFDVTDSAGVYAQGSLTIRRDSSQLRNSIIVRGGEYLGTEFTASVKADGSQRTFSLPYRYQDFKIRVAGVVKTVGIDNIDDAASYDALYNFQEKIVKFREDNKPVANATLSFAGKPYLPVIVKVKDQSLVNTIYSAEAQGDGKYEYLVVDKSITTKAGARERALAEINTYGSTLSEGEFVTETAGLVAGQRILVNSASRGINEYFVVNKVTSQMKDYNSMIYNVSLITTKTMNFISIMKKLLLAETKKIEISTDEVLDLVEVASDEIGLTDAITVQALSYVIDFRLAPQAVTGTKRPFTLNGSWVS